MQIKNFSESLERDLSKLHGEIGAVRAKPESANLPEREIVKESVRSYIEKAPDMPAAAPLPATPPPSVPPASHDAASFPDYFDRGEVSEAVKAEVIKLVETVFAEGIHAAVRQSRMRAPFVQDAFHDALVDKLMPELKRRGIVK